MNNPEIILQAIDLEIGYGKKAKTKSILGGINATLLQGELVCLIGPNGVGKSTLLRTLCGVQKPLSGRIFLDGKALNEYERHMLAKKISLVLTEKITGNLTAYDLIALGRYPYTDWAGSLTQDDDRVIQKAIEGTQTTDILNQKVFELSDGQLQKALIARALAQDGSLMILDEPSAHLDVKNKVEILLLLQKLSKERNKAILIATHDLDLAMQTADRLWLMDYGQPLGIGLPEELALNGKISAAFKSNEFSFDLESGRIKLSKQPIDSIKVEGQGMDYFWTCHALERAGFNINDKSNIVVSVAEKTWNLIFFGEQKTLCSLGELMDYLKGRLPGY